MAGVIILTVFEVLGTVRAYPTVHVPVLSQEPEAPVSVTQEVPSGARAGVQTPVASHVPTSHGLSCGQA